MESHMLKNLVKKVCSWWRRVRFQAGTLISLALIIEWAVNFIDKVWKLGALL
jgi:hypothetical protein